ISAPPSSKRERIEESRATWGCLIKSTLTEAKWVSMCKMHCDASLQRDLRTPSSSLTITSRVSSVAATSWARSMTLSLAPHSID
ncbi:unnamed protein product, partial [Chrysoparadoxa australica]